MFVCNLQVSDDRMGLMSTVNLDLESGTVNTRSNRLPPEWYDYVGAISTYKGQLLYFVIFKPLFNCPTLLKSARIKLTRNY